MEVVFRRSFWDPSIAVPCLTLLTLGVVLIALWPSEALPIGLPLAGLGLYRVYLGLRFRYVISGSGIKVLKGDKPIKQVNAEEIRKSKIKIRGGRVRGLSGTAIAALILATQRGLGLFMFLDVGTVEFINQNGKTVLKIKGVNVGRFFESLKKVQGLGH